MTTLAGLTTTLFGASPGDQGIIQDSSYYATATARINAAVTVIAGGERLPDGRVSPPLPDLYSSSTIETATDAAYKALPTTYQRHVFMVADSSGNQLFHPSGGDYYSFGLFLRNASHKGLTQAGSISSVVVKGKKLFYQGIPSSSKTLTLHFYSKPTAMSEATDEPDGLPEHLSENLIVHYVAKEIFSDIEDGDNSKGTGYSYHTSRFYEALVDLVDFIGFPDAVPEYYGEGSAVDLGVCD